MGITIGIPLSASILTYSTYNKSQTTIATLIIGSLAIVLLESIQYLSDIRSVQFQDIVDGIAGIAITSVIAIVFLSLIGVKIFMVLFTTISVISLSATSLIIFGNNNLGNIIPNNCLASTFRVNSWDRVLIHTFKHNSRYQFSAHPEIPLCVFKDGVSVSGNELVFSGGGLRSAELTGLLSAIREKRSFTFGARFTSHSQNAVGLPPMVVARVNYQDYPRIFLARILNFRNSGSATIQFNNQNRTGTAFLNSLNNEQHNVVISYDGSIQRTWLDGKLIGSETNFLEPPTGKGELVLNIGWRSDKFLKPFKGSIQQIFIGTTAVRNATQANDIFTDYQKATDIN